MTIIRPTPTLEFELCAERTLWWPQQKTLFLADLHLGRALPSDGAEALLHHTLTRISTAIKRYNASRVVILGDMFHMKRHYNQELLQRVRDWRETIRPTDMMLVRGNHERVLGDPPAELDITCVDPGYCEDTVTFLHEPRVTESFTLCAHLHPNILVPSQRVAAEAVPCFVLGTSYIVLPAFEDTLPGRIIPNRSDESYAYIQHGLVVFQ
ncbi:MAG: hypothetical protein RLY87_2326 [Chloroflexota bacterium]|jgi:DNA ligase-associated metallophosphoesterase